jgi:hypothetical protein
MEINVENNDSQTAGGLGLRTGYVSKRVASIFRWTFKIQMGHIQQNINDLPL